jgi:hypothetical protein
VFIGSDFDDLKRYKEFEVSPQNEWVDPDINLSAPRHEDGGLWNSGFEHSARIDCRRTSGPQRREFRWLRWAFRRLRRGQPFE